MAKVSVYNMEGKEVDTIDLSDEIFAIAPYTLLPINSSPLPSSRMEKRPFSQIM